MVQRRRQQWWNSFGFESKFKQRQIARVIAFALAYVGISTVCMAAVYAAILRPLSRAEMPLLLKLEILRDTGGIPGFAEVILLWATLMSCLSVLFAVVVGLYFSHKLAGPLFRFKLELKRVAAGQPTQLVTLRKGDEEFQDIADALNGALGRIETGDRVLRDQLEDSEARLEELRQGMLRHVDDPEALRALVEKSAPEPTSG